MFAQVNHLAHTTHHTCVYYMRDTSGPVNPTVNSSHLLNMSRQNTLSLLLLFTLVASSLQFTSLSSSEVDAIKKKIRTVVRGPTLATAVRLSFHDCVGIFAYFHLNSFIDFSYQEVVMAV